MTSNIIPLKISSDEFEYLKNTRTNFYDKILKYIETNDTDDLDVLAAEINTMDKLVEFYRELVRYMCGCDLTISIHCDNYTSNL